MIWAELLNHYSWLPWLIFLIVQIPLLYSISEQFRFYIRMSLYYLTILVAATLAIPISLPSYFMNMGGSWSFNMFNLCSSWIDVNVEVRNKEILDSVSGPAVVVANHQSSLDIITMGKCWPYKCTVIMKNSLKWIPGFNLSAFLCNTIFVKRFTQSVGANPAVDQAVEIMRRKGMKIWIFPEGTRHHAHGFLPFRKGAFNIAVCAQIPIIPIVISDYEPFYSQPKKYFRSPGHVIAQVLNPVPTEGLTYDDVSKLSEQIRTEMLEVYEKLSAEAKSRHGQSVEIPAESEKLATETKLRHEPNVEVAGIEVPAKTE